MKLSIFESVPSKVKIKFLSPEIASATNIPGHVILDQIGNKIVIKSKVTRIRRGIRGWGLNNSQNYDKIKRDLHLE